eukprot:363391-Chlamydomonas_euryale.AAC.14
MDRHARTDLGNVGFSYDCFGPAQQHATIDGDFIGVEFAGASVSSPGFGAALPVAVATPIAVRRWACRHMHHTVIGGRGGTWRCGRYGMEEAARQAVKLFSCSSCLLPQKTFFKTWL